MSRKLVVTIKANNRGFKINEELKHLESQDSNASFSNDVVSERENL